MGLTKKMLDEFFELDEVNYPDDLDLSYESWCEQRDLEKIAYEEMLADSK